MTAGLCSFQTLDVWLGGLEVSSLHLVPRAACVVALVRGFLDPLLWLCGTQVGKIKTSQNHA